MGQKKKNDKYSFEHVWGELINEHGFTPIPNLVIEHQGELGINPTEVNVLMQIWKFKWTRDNPYPSLVTIADQMGMSVSTVRRNVRSLDSKNYLDRIRRKGRTNEYNFEGLRNKLITISKNKDGSIQNSQDHSLNTDISPSAMLDTKEDSF